MLAVAASVKAVKQRLKAIAELNLELAKLEGKQKATAAGITAGLGIGAALLVLYGIGFGLAAAAAGLNEALPLWASLLIVAGAILIVATILGLLAKHFAKRISPPLPVNAIEEADRTVKALQGHV
jgi:Flp pilus assembly protein TadB